METDYLFLVFTRKLDPISRLGHEAGERQRNVSHRVVISLAGEMVREFTMEGFTTADACSDAIRTATEVVNDLPIEENKGKELEIRMEISRRKNSKSEWTLRKTIVQRGTLVSFSELRKKR